MTSTSPGFTTASAAWMARLSPGGTLTVSAGPYMRRPGVSGRMALASGSAPASASRVEVSQAGMGGGVVIAVSLSCGACALLAGAVRKLYWLKLCCTWQNNRFRLDRDDLWKRRMGNDGVT